MEFPVYSSVDWQGGGPSTKSKSFSLHKGESVGAWCVDLVGLCIEIGKSCKTMANSDEIDYKKQTKDSEIFIKERLTPLMHLSTMWNLTLTNHHD